MILKKINKNLEINGINLRKILYSISQILNFYSDLRKYKKAENSVYKLSIEKKNLFIVLSDKKSSAGISGGHYFHQDLWAAKKIYQDFPESHMDVGSSIEGFISHLLVFMKNVKVIDIRKLESDIENLVFIQSDATLLEAFDDNSVNSLSSLHAAEHFGLGRYGDFIDPIAHIKFMQNLARVLEKEGKLYFSVPVGVERLEFNAQRILSPYTVLKIFEEKGLKLLEFSLVKDDGKLYINADMGDAANQKYGCGLYQFTK